MAEDLSFSQMLAMQQELWEKYREKWSPMEPRYARNSLLWMMGEIGEAIDIIKKCEEERIMSDPGVRAAFIEELCDVQMYFNDVLLRYGITAEDMACAYEKKHAFNMKRDYETKNKAFSDSL